MTPSLMRCGPLAALLLCLPGAAGADPALRGSLQLGVAQADGGMASAMAELRLALVGRDATLYGGIRHGFADNRLGIGKSRWRLGLEVPVGHGLAAFVQWDHSHRQRGNWGFAGVKLDIR